MLAKFAGRCTLSLMTTTVVKFFNIILRLLRRVFRKDVTCLSRIGSYFGHNISASVQRFAAEGLGIAPQHGSHGPP